MNDMTGTIIPKSDQLNADDLIAGRTLTIKITKVGIAGGDQPVFLHYEGDNGKPYKPGKSMRRVLVSVWGADATQYTGRSVTLYRDDKVKFGGVMVGGIRISHMSNITESVTMALTETRASRKPFQVKPLKIAAKPDFDALLSDIKTAQDLIDLESTFKEAYRHFAEEDKRGELVAAKDARKAELTATIQA